MKRILTYLLIVPLFALVACEPRTDDDLATMDADTTAMQQDTRYTQAELQGWLDEIDRNMEQLQTRAQEAGENVDFDMDELRQRRDEIRQELQGTGTQEGWTADLGRDLQGRLRDLDADVEEARLKSIEQRDEFLTEVRTRMNEIDSELEALGRRAGVTTQPGMQDDADMGMTDEPTTEPRTDAYGTAPGTTGDTYAAGDVNVEELRSDRDDIREQLQEIETGAETEFDDFREDLAESVADLRARVQEASLELRGQTNMSMQTSPNTAVN